MCRGLLLLPRVPRTSERVTEREEGAAMARHATSPLRPYPTRASLVYSCSSASKLAVFIWVLLCTKVEAHNVTAEMEALKTFQHLTSAIIQWVSPFVPRYLPTSHWDSWNENDTSPCKWVGISCTTNGSVRSIDVSGWGLYMSPRGGLSTTGSLCAILNPLNRLENLEQLSLSRNRFFSKIPSAIGSLTNLRHLDLSDNSFDGEIPPLNNLTQLQVLFLARNQLDGPIPDHLNNLSSLVSLDLSSNSFDGSVPVLTNLVNLRELNLENNHLTGFADSRFPGPRRLKYLFASGNQLRGNLPVGLTEMLDLEILDMSSNKFSGEIPKGLARSTTSNYWVDLSQNLLEGRIPDDLFWPLSDLPGFHLNLSYNNLSGNIPELSLSTETTVRSRFKGLDLSHNQLNGSLPIWLVSDGPLWLEGNQLSGDIVDALPSLLDRATIEIRLANNRFTGELTRMIGKWKRGAYTVEVIDLSNNLLTMSETKKYTDPMRSTLEDLLSLTRLSHLREFRIAGNKLEGISLPEVVSVPQGDPTMITPLEVLDVSNNHLVGSIAEEVYTPSTLPAIKVLNFSSNHLTGRVPYDVTRLPTLIALDVSWNNLSGRLPDIPPRSSLWDANLFAGNPWLCGGPLPQCSSSGPPPTDSVAKGNGLSPAALSAIILSSVLVPLASCLMLGWRWSVYKKLHKQDADLIATLLERDRAALMPLRDLKRATRNFAESAQIGQGGFGTVYTGKLQDGTIVAIKRGKQEGSETSKQQFLNEVRVLCQVSHRHLVKLLGCCLENKAALLVFEFVSNGTLKEHLHSKKGSRLSWKQRLEIAMQTSDALNYLHSIPIVHRDVKSANILLTEKLKVKVADFGISKLVSAETAEATHFSTVAIQGTIGYIDPEYYTSCQLTVKSDVYSFGVVLLELISAQSALDFQRPSGDCSLIIFAKSLIQNQELESLIDPVLKESFNFETNWKESVMSVGALALQCLQDRSKDRPDMKEVWKQLQTAWVSYEGLSDLLDAPSSIHEEPDNKSMEESVLSCNLVYGAVSSPVSNIA